MHPAFSVIFFTVFSGAGLGSLFWLGLSEMLMPGLTVWSYGVAIICALSLTAAGLLASVGHLGHPERAWMALSQWRSSWLSREGVAAILCFPAAGMLIGTLVMGWESLVLFAGILLSVISVITLFCTAMIYQSLRAIPAWNHHLVVPGYLSLGLMSGGVLWLIFVGFEQADVTLPGLVASVTILVGWGVKRGYWGALSKSIGQSSIGTATGLSAFGAVRQFAPPHDADNYLLKEMGYQVARKHADKLRRLTQALGFMIPLLMCLIALVIGGLLAAFFGLVAFLSMIIGLLIERWLFFAEAQHVVTLYYGRSLKPIPQP